MSQIEKDNDMLKTTVCLLSSRNSKLQQDLLRERELRRVEWTKNRESEKKNRVMIVRLRKKILNQQTQFAMRLVEMEKKLETCVSDLVVGVPDDDFEINTTEKKKCSHDIQPVTPEKPDQTKHKPPVLETNRVDSSSRDEIFDDDFETDVPQEHIVDCSGDVAPITPEKPKQKKRKSNTNSVRRSKRIK